MKLSSTTCFGDLADVEGIKFGGHTGLDETPFHLVAMRQDGREGENENILDCIFYNGITASIDCLDAVHTILQTGEVMPESKVFGLIGQLLDRAEYGGQGVGGGHSVERFLLLYHMLLCVVDDVIAKGMPDFVGYLIIKGLRG
jgi:hypothetical protein